MNNGDLRKPLLRAVFAVIAFVAAVTAAHLLDRQPESLSATATLSILN